MDIKSINRDNAFWHLIQKLALLILILLIIIPIMVFGMWNSRKNINSAVYKENRTLVTLKNDIKQMDATVVSDQSFLSKLIFITWLKEAAKPVNLSIYSDTNNLKILATQSQQELDEYSNKLSLDEAFSFGGMVKFIIIDKNNGTYITNDKGNFVSSQIKLFSQENGELYSYVSSVGKYYNITYNSNASPASTYAYNKILIDNPSQYVEAYWFPKNFVITDSTIEYLDKIKNVIKEDINNNISLENTILIDSNKQLILNESGIIFLSFLEVALAISLYILGWKGIKVGIRNSLITRFILRVNDTFDRLHTLVKVSILVMGVLSVQLINIYYPFFSLYPQGKIAFVFRCFFIFYLVVLLPKLIIFCVQLERIITGSKRITSGDIEYVITEKGDKRLSELAKNINKINKGFKVSIQEQITNERLKSELVANVSHDLKTPLTSIINYTDLLTRDNVTKEEKEEYIQILYKKSIKLKHLIEDLFEISKINSGKIKLEKSEVDIVEIINQAIVEYSDTDLYYSKNLSFNVKSFEPNIVMSLDGNKLSRVFENLINNVLKYSLKDTRVFVDVEKMEKGIRIVFKNTSEAPLDFDKKEILGSFTRGDKSRNSEIEGSGLGLAIAKSIIELHDGILYIDFDGDLFKVIIEFISNTL